MGRQTIDKLSAVELQKGGGGTRANQSAGCWTYKKIVERSFVATLPIDWRTGH